MKNEYSLYKFKLLSFLLIISFLAFSSCVKDPPSKTSEKKDNAASQSFVVDYLPSQCADTHSGQLGLISSKGLYYQVFDTAETFHVTYKKGDRVKVEVDRVVKYINCRACTCPAPDVQVVVNKVELE